MVVVPPESNRRSFRRGQENCKYFGQSVPPLLSINVTPCQPHLGLIHLSLRDIFHISGAMQSHLSSLDDLFTHALLRAPCSLTAAKMNHTTSLGP